MNRLSLILVVSVFLFGCAGKAEKQVQFSNQHIAQVIDKMGDLMIQDVSNPPLAARFFAYTCLAGYEVVSQHEADLPSMHGRLNQYPAITKPEPLAAIPIS